MGKRQKCSISMDTKIKMISDNSSALEIARENSHFFNAHGLEEMEKDFKTGILFGAYFENNLYGFICFKEHNDQVIEIAWMAVRPHYQDQGMGTLLFEEGIKLLDKKYKICEVKTLSEIDPDPEYSKTRNFYRKLGFIPVETIHPYPGWGDDNPCQIFVKLL